MTQHKVSAAWGKVLSCVKGPPISLGLKENKALSTVLTFPGKTKKPQRGTRQEKRKSKDSTKLDLGDSMSLISISHLQSAAPPAPPHTMSFQGREI